jgi:hypothetical protein
MRRLVGALFAIVLVVGSVSAAEVQGTIAKIDADKGLLVLKVGEQSKEFTLAKECKCECPFGKELKDGLKNSFLFKAGFPVQVTYETKEGKDVVSKVKSAVKIEKAPGQ